MWRTDNVTPAPDQLERRLGQADSPYKGKVTAYDSPIYIADAALYLMETQPDLGIENPYELDEEQFQAAVDLLKQQRANIGEYWSDYTKEIAAFTERQQRRRDDVAGDQANVLAGEKVPVETMLPKEGSTGWSDTWMISSKAKHPNCMYLWMDHIISPKANADATEYFGEAPSSKEACALTADKNHCKTFHAEDEEYFEQIWYWTTPQADCGDDRGRSARTTPSGPRPGRRSRGRPSRPLRDSRRRPGSPPGGASLRSCYRHPRLRVGLLLTPPLSWLVLAYLGSLARALRGGVLAARPVHLAGRPRLRLPELPAALGERRLPHDHAPDDRDRGGRDRDRRPARVPDRVLHGEGRVAADAEPARRRGPAAALGELPGQGLRLADHPAGERDPELGARAARALRPGLRERRHLARLQLPLAAVHDPAGLRGARADPELAARGVGRPRRQGAADALARRAAAGAAGDRGGLDLHLLADARRLHHAAARLEHAVHRQRRLHQRRRREQPPVRGRVRDRAGRS